MTEDFTVTEKDIRNLTRRICQASGDDPGEPISGKEILLLQLMIGSYGIVILECLKANPALFDDLVKEHPEPVAMAATLITEFKAEARSRHSRQEGDA